MVTGEEQGDQGEKADQGEGAVITAEEAPGGAGIAPMDEFEKTGHNDLFVPGAQRSQDEPFGELVQRENDDREHGDVAIGLLKDGLGGGHPVQSPKSKVQ